MPTTYKANELKTKFMALLCTKIEKNNIDFSIARAKIEELVRESVESRSKLVAPPTAIFLKNLG